MTLPVSWLCLALTAAGCGTNAKQVEQWREAQDLPHLAAVVKGDDDDALRVEAALALLELDAVRGRRIGVDALIATLRPMDDAQRATLMNGLIDPLIDRIEKSDDAFAYKDAAYELLVKDEQPGAPLLKDEAQRDKLVDALAIWAVSDFKARTDNRKDQLHGMKPLFEVLGPKAVAKLVPVIHVGRDSAIAIIVASGDATTKKAASKVIASEIKEAADPEWRNDRRDDLTKANKQAGLEPTEQQFEQQLLAYQRENLTRVLKTAKQIGGPYVTVFCLEIAADAKRDGTTRQLALAALEGHIESSNAGHVAKLIEIIRAGAPAAVVDMALRRVRELPRATVAESLYTMFDGDDWRLRRAAAGALLKMSRAEHIDEFMEQLGRRATRNFLITEALTYGALLGALEGGDVRAALEKHHKSGLAPARMSAFAFDFSHGAKKNIAALEPFESDPQPLPPCTEADCSRSCIVAGEDKDISTIGEFVSYCIKPQMDRDEPPTTQPGTSPIGAGGGLDLGGGGHGGGLKDIGNDGPGEGTKVVGSVRVGGAGVAGGKVANAATVVARMRGRFRACYQAGLNDDPGLQGAVTLVAKLGAGGEVTKVTGGGGALGAIFPCLEAVVRSGGFSSPEGGSAIVSIPITFVKQ